MFKIQPVPGADVKATLARLEETWGDCEIDPNDAANIPNIHVIRTDLFELIGIVKGLMMALEVGPGGGFFPHKENDPD